MINPGELELLPAGAACSVIFLSDGACEDNRIGTTLVVSYEVIKKWGRRMSDPDQRAWQVRPAVPLSP